MNCKVTVKYSIYLKEFLIANFLSKKFTCPRNQLNGHFFEIREKNTVDIFDWTS